MPDYQNPCSQETVEFLNYVEQAAPPVAAQ